jgi:carbamoyl-phosphate synthase small subunit
MKNSLPALLALEDGSLFEGISIGIPGQTQGEVVFNTAMTGYQECLSDPSYTQQILTLTYPHIGNVGTNADDNESAKAHVAGLVIRDETMITSNYRSEQSLADYLQEHKIVAIAGIDTRRLTHLLRQKGAQKGCIIAGENPDKERALALAKSFAGLEGADLTPLVSTQKAYEWTKSIVVPAKAGIQPTLEKLDPRLRGEDRKPHVIAYDFGVKYNSLRLLVDLGCKVTVVPAHTSAKEALALKPDGIFLSNGPGDPAACKEIIQIVRELLETHLPLFGVCLGHQLLALATGAKTLKMKLGHHGANHPVQAIATKKVFVTSQNHGFAVDEASLPANVTATHRSLFDNTLQGIALSDKPAFSFQGHPEAGPGPHDIQDLFQQFVEMMK